MVDREWGKGREREKKGGARPFVLRQAQDELRFGGMGVELGVGLTMVPAFAGTSREGQGDGGNWKSSEGWLLGGCGRKKNVYNVVAASKGRRYTGLAAKD